MLTNYSAYEIIVIFLIVGTLFVCIEVLLPNQHIRVMSSAVSLPNHTFSWAGLVL